MLKTWDAGAARELSGGGGNKYPACMPRVGMGGRNDVFKIRNPCGTVAMDEHEAEEEEEADVSGLGGALGGADAVDVVSNGRASGAGYSAGGSGINTPSTTEATPEGAARVRGEAKTL